MLVGANPPPNHVAEHQTLLNWIPLVGDVEQLGSCGSEDNIFIAVGTPTSLNE